MFPQHGTIVKDISPIRASLKLTQFFKAAKQLSASCLAPNMIVSNPTAGHKITKSQLKGKSLNHGVGIPRGRVANPRDWGSEELWLKFHSFLHFYRKMRRDG